MLPKLDGNKLYILVLGHISIIKDTIYRIQPLYELIRLHLSFKLCNLNFGIESTMCLTILQDIMSQITWMRRSTIIRNMAVCLMERININTIIFESFILIMTAILVEMQTLLELLDLLPQIIHNKVPLIHLRS